MIQKWKNVPGELLLDAGIMLQFTSTGYHDKGVCSGPVEKCYPPEHEEERLVDNGVLIFEDGFELPLPSDLLNQIAEHFEKEINDVDIDYDML